MTAPLWRGSAVRDEEYPLPEGSGKGPNGDLMGYGETPNGPFGTPKWGVLRGSGSRGFPKSQIGGVKWGGQIGDLGHYSYPIGTGPLDGDLWPPKGILPLMGPKWGPIWSIYGHGVWEMVRGMIQTPDPDLGSRSRSRISRNGVKWDLDHSKWDPI